MTNEQLKRVIPKAFISYAWESEEHKTWVRELAARLRKDGIETILDQWHAIQGDQLTEFMERSVRENDFVLIICTPRYKRKSDDRSGGVGYEGDIMTAEAMISQSKRKFIPILRQGDWIDAASSWLLGKYYVDLRWDPYSEINYQALVHTLRGENPQAPPVSTIDKLETHYTPAFITDRISKNEIGFTILNPNSLRQIKLVDIKLLSLEVFYFMSSFEERFELSDVLLKEETENDVTNTLFIDLGTAKSIFYDNKIVRINENDSASFRVKLYGEAHLAHTYFRFSAAYIDNRGMKGEILSDNVYYAEKWINTNKMQHIVGISPKDVIGKLEKGDCSGVRLLEYFKESDFPDIDIFSWLVDLYKSKLCAKDQLGLIEAIGYFTNIQHRYDETLKIIDSLDDIKDFGAKCFFIRNLIRGKDRRVIPYAESFLKNTENLTGVSDFISIEGARAWLKEELENVLI